MRIFAKRDAKEQSFLTERGIRDRGRKFGPRPSLGLSSALPKTYL